MSACPAPQSLHQIQLPWGMCAYVLKRSKRNSIGFLIRSNRLEILAPLRLTLTEIEHFIQSKARWIEKKLDQSATKHAQSTTLENLLRKGQSIPVRGRPYSIDILSPESKAFLNPWTHCIALPETGPVQQIKLLEKTLRLHAQEVFEQTAQRLVQQRSLPNFSIHLSSATARWGSCNSKREIRLNWRLVHCPQNLIDYVVAHELAHLLEMNHSQRFWNFVHELMPNYRESHKILSNMIPSKVNLP